MGDEKLPADLPIYKCGHWGNRNKRGELCGQSCVKGTRACRNHSGRPLVEHSAEGQIRLEFANWTLDEHDGADIDPAVELLRLISFWKWRANLLSKLVRDAYAAAEELRAAHAAQALLLAEPVTESRYDREGEYEGETPEDPVLATARHHLQQVFATGGVSTFVGHRFDVDREGRIFAVEEGIRVLVKLEGEAHDRFANMCKYAIQAKVAQTRIDLAEEAGIMIQAVILGVLRRLGVSATDRQVQDIVMAEIDVVTGQAAIAA